MINYHHVTCFALAALAPAALPCYAGSVSADGAAVRVLAYGHPDQSGSGFLWRDGNRTFVVTALHLVVGASAIEIELTTSSGKKDVADATVHRALLGDDLALLRTKDDLHGPAFGVTDKVTANERVFAIDFRFSISREFENELRVERTSLRLRDRVPDDSLQELERSGVISVDSTIISLDGALAPGSSGCPIVNSEGKIVAIGNGGLARGAGNVSWAIPADRIAELLSSDDPIPSSVGRVTKLFATPVERRQPDSIEIEGQRFWATRRLSVAELARTADDVVGTRWVIGELNKLLPGEDIEGWDFEVLLAENASIALALPADREYEGDSFSRGPVNLQMGALNGVPIPQRDMLFQGFLAQRVFRTPAPWPVVAAQPLPRSWDNVLFQRGFHANPFLPVSGQTGAFAFVSRVESSRTVLHMGAIADRLPAQMPIGQRRAWAKAVLAVCLSTVVRS